MNFRPCIDIHNGKVKQIVGSTLANDSSVTENFVADKDATYFANLYKQDGLFGGHVIMLDQSDETNQQALNALKAFPNGLHIGGGITPKNAKQYIDAGASHVIVTSYIFENEQLSLERVQKLVDTVGKDHIVLDLSCRKRDDTYYVATDRWQTFTDFEVNQTDLDLLSNYCDEFLVHGVDSEGKKQGIEEQLLTILKDCNKTPITYAGGVTNFVDIKKIKTIGNGNINFTIGSALDIFGGSLDYKLIAEQFK